MKQQITTFLLGLCIGTLLMVNPLCKQKDSMIRLLMNKTGNNAELAQIPKGLPIVNIGR